MKRLESRLMGVILLALMSGCVDGAKLIQEHETGGVVIYPFKAGQGALLSVFRSEALAIMKEKCGGGSYEILREGEAKSRARVIAPLEGQEEIIEERRWGIEFRCK